MERPVPIGMNWILYGQIPVALLNIVTHYLVKLNYIRAVIPLEITSIIFYTRSTNRVTSLRKKQSPHLMVSSNFWKCARIEQLLKHRRWMRKYSDRKDSFNDFHYFQGKILTNSFSKKVSRFTNRVILLWKAAYAENLNFPFVGMCKNWTLDVWVFWRGGFIQRLPVFLRKKFD